MTLISALLIFVALILYILGQLFLKHAMESDLRSARFAKFFGAGLATMTFSFLLRLDYSSVSTSAIFIPFRD